MYSSIHKPTVSIAFFVLTPRTLTHLKATKLTKFMYCLEFELNEETYQYLKKLPGPLGVISVAGMYRSGKSYLLNRMLLNRSSGFDVGHTINACTKVSIKI